MCSIGEDDFGDEGGVHAMVPDAKPQYGDTPIVGDEVLNKLCNKCQKSGAAYKLPFREAECRECFLLYASHKFRAALGSSKVLPKDAQVILVFDGSSESMVLLDMLHHAQTQNTFKRLHCKATVLYIDDFHLTNNVDKEQEKYDTLLINLQKFLEKYEQFKSYIVPLVDITDVCGSICEFKLIKEQQYHLENLKKQQLFTDTTEAIKSLTSRQDFVKHQRSKLIATVAKHCKCQFAFIPDVSSKLASDLLAAVALGRGASAALDVSLVDDRLGDGIKIIRPLKDLNVAEIELYLKAKNLRPLQLKRYGLDMGSAASLQNLTKTFIDNLQQNFSSTVSTVFRTGDKIAVNEDIFKKMEDLNVKNFNCTGNHCSFCKSVLDYHDSNTLLAIEFSRLVSLHGFSIDKYNDLNTMSEQTVRGLSNTKTLCHACRNIRMESTKNNLLL